MDSYIGEIRAVGFDFAPVGWALCSGQLMAISSNTALFSLLGTTYGGDGRTTFQLPNLNGRSIVQAGQGPGLSSYRLAETRGTENETLQVSQLPLHSHALSGTFRTQAADGNFSSPTGHFLAGTAEGQYSESVASGTMAPRMLEGMAAAVGSGQPHTNMMPSLVINYIICLKGIFPPRS